jgi:hypothetical protein
LIWFLLSHFSASVVPGFQAIGEADYDCLRIANGVFDGSVDAISGEFNSDMFAFKFE